MSNKKEEIHECDCFKPEVRNSFIDGCCSDDQIIKCHGSEYLNHLKRKGD